MGVQYQFTDADTVATVNLFYNTGKLCHADLQIQERCPILVWKRQNLRLSSARATSAKLCHCTTADANTIKVQVRILLGTTQQASQRVIYLM